MKPMVLCITREALESQGIPYNSKGIFNFDLTKVPQDDFHFINRKIVDDKHDEDWQAIAYHLPQILPYIVITNGQGKYLSYSRNGTEQRLHGSKSIGIGGHIDIDDLFSNYNSKHTVHMAIQVATFRELIEEVGLDKDNSYDCFKFKKLIVDTSNPVGKVHVGLFAGLIYPEAVSQEELYNPQWLTIDELKQTIDQYENWSQLIIKDL